MERFQQVDKIEINTDQSLTTIQVFGQMGERELEIVTDVHLMPEKDYIRVILNRILLNGFDFTWLINLFKNHPVPPLKLNKYPFLGLELNNVKQQNGLLVLNYNAPKRINK